MTQTIGDPTFGLNAQALAVLAMLAQMEPDFAPFNDATMHYDCRIRTFPMYGGRERGFCLVVERGEFGEGLDNQALHIFVCEARSSDNIRIMNWRAPTATYKEPKLPDDDDDDAFWDGNGDHQDSVAVGRIDLAIDVIWKLCEGYFAEVDDTKEPDDEAARPGAPFMLTTIDTGMMQSEAIKTVREQLKNMGKVEGEDFVINHVKVQGPS